jgi:hypothetical protein
MLADWTLALPGATQPGARGCWLPSATGTIFSLAMPRERVLSGPFCFVMVSSCELRVLMR